MLHTMDEEGMLNIIWMEERMLTTEEEGEDGHHIGWRRGCSPQRMEERMLTT